MLNFMCLLIINNVGEIVGFYSIFGSPLTAVPNGIPNTETAITFDTTLIENITQSDFQNYSALHTLAVRKSELRYVDDNAFEGTVISQLELWENKLTEVPKAIRNIKQTLQTLYLYTNKIERINKDTFENMTSLKIVNLKDNIIVCISKEAFCRSAVESLNLQNNKLIYIPDMACLASLNVINLRGNLIADPANLYTIAHSSNIDLQDNNLNWVTNFTAFSTGFTIFLGGNPLICTCNLRFLKDAPPAFSIWVFTASCIYPPHMVGVSFFNLNPDMFHCYGNESTPVPAVHPTCGDESIEIISTEGSVELSTYVPDVTTNEDIPTTQTLQAGTTTSTQLPEETSQPVKRTSISKTATAQQSSTMMLTTSSMPTSKTVYASKDKNLLFNVWTRWSQCTEVKHWGKQKWRLMLQDNFTLGDLFLLQVNQLKHLGVRRQRQRCSYGNSTWTEWSTWSNCSCSSASANAQRRCVDDTGASAADLRCGGSSVKWKLCSTVCDTDTAGNNSSEAFHFAMFSLANALTSSDRRTSAIAVGSLACIVTTVALASIVLLDFQLLVQALLNK